MTLVFGSALRRVHSPGSGLGEIKDEETGENLLEDKVRLLCVKMDEAHGVFQAAEGGLNAPASGVEDLESGEGEPVRAEIGDKGFRVAAVGLQTDNAKGYFVEIRAVRL